MGKACKYKSLAMSYFTVIFLSLICLICSGCKFAYATNNLLPGQSLHGNQNLLSNNGAFKLGFSCGDPPGYSYCNYGHYGVWLTNSSTFCGHFMVWEPDADIALSDTWSLSFTLSEDGILHLTNGDFLLWSSNSTKNSLSSAVAVLLDSGNLVIRDQVNSSVVFWQSFDHPTDTLLPGGSLGVNGITGKNMSLNSHNYTLEIDASRRRGFIIRHNPDGRMYYGTFPSWMDIQEDGDNFLTFNGVNKYIRLDSNGTVSFSMLGECGSVLWSASGVFCSYHTYCGPYGLCATSSSTDQYLCTGFNNCSCPVGFDPPPANMWGTVGCSRTKALNCEGNVSVNQEVSFYPIDNIYKFPDRPRSFGGRSTKECEVACLKDCSCAAYSYNTACLLWYGELQYTILQNSGSNGGNIYIRLAKQQNRTTKIVVILGLVGGMLAISAVVLTVLCRSRTKLYRTQPVDANGCLVVFSYSQVKNATKSFSEKIGEGGFGCVFKGTLPGCTVVAVKKLKGLGQGEKQFRAEVQTIGLIQHMNLVPLLGFCAEDSSRRLLVYEYMANGSLNSHLFSKSSAKLSWKRRYFIALGIAKGLAYLHEECKDCIVHCDMKPDNVLLDAEFCPKIADFGMAKLVGRDFSRALTTMRGTIGYLAPEWISGLPITHKADVYSYGMTLLEIISGRRNAEKIKEGKFTHFPTFAAVKVNEGDVMCLMDSMLEGNADVEQLNKACRIACWCIHDAEDHRPMMGQVVHMLEGTIDVEVPPIPRSLQNFVDMEDCTHSADSNSF